MGERAPARPVEGGGKPRGRIIGDERPSTVKRRIARHAERIGLPRVTMENTRHTWATMAVAAGVPIETVAMMLGHAPMETAYQHYIRPSRSVMVDAHARVVVIPYTGGRSTTTE